MKNPDLNWNDPDALKRELEELEQSSPVSLDQVVQATSQRSRKNNRACAVNFSAKRLRRWCDVIKENNLAGKERTHFEASVFLLAALELNTHDTRSLWAATRFPVDCINKWKTNLTDNQIWLPGDKWAIGEDVDLNDPRATTVCFALWTLVATGEVIHIPGKVKR